MNEYYGSGSSSNYYMEPDLLAKPCCDGSEHFDIDEVDYTCKECGHIKDSHTRDGFCTVEHKDGSATFVCKCQEYRDDNSNNELQNMLDKQFEFMHEIKGKYPIFNSMGENERLEKLTIAAVDELMEFRNELNWKWWKKPKTLDRVKLKEELIDVFHFVFSLAIELDMDAKEILRVFDKKQCVNRDRQESGY